MWVNSLFRIWILIFRTFNSNFHIYKQTTPSLRPIWFNPPFFWKNRVILPLLCFINKELRDRTITCEDFWFRSIWYSLREKTPMLRPMSFISQKPVSENLFISFFMIQSCNLVGWKFQDDKVESSKFPLKRGRLHFLRKLVLLKVKLGVELTRGLIVL